MQSLISSIKGGLYDQLLSSIDQEFSEQNACEAFSAYQSNPVGFGEDVLCETFTDEVKVLMDSVRDHPVTVAQSSNAVGKTHAAARIAVWWYKVFSDSQIYTAAAPPESNLKKLLWGEIGGIAEKHPDLFKNDTITNLHISRSSQSFLTGVTIGFRTGASCVGRAGSRSAGITSITVKSVIAGGSVIGMSTYSGPVTRIIGTDVDVIGTNRPARINAAIGCFLTGVKLRPRTGIAAREALKAGAPRHPQHPRRREGQRPRRGRTTPPRAPPPPRAGAGSPVSPLPRARRAAFRSRRLRSVERRF
mgnify:CR=1 FL=1